MEHDEHGSTMAYIIYIIISNNTTQIDTLNTDGTCIQQ